MFAETFLSLVGFIAVQAAQPTSLVLRELPVAKYVPGPYPIPVKRRADTFGVDTTARAAFVVDVPSGRSLYEKDSNTPYPVASLTKLMTAMVLLDSTPDLREEVTLTDEDDPHEGKAVFPIGERLTKQELLQALLVGSVNMAGNALARTTGGTESFVKKMNAKAHELGMWRASFVDPTGLNSENQASARDVAFALRAALNYPAIREITKQEKIDLQGHATGKPYAVKSTNLLLGSFLNKSPYRIMAGKTGSLKEAGFCLAQATRDEEDHEIITVVLGSENHFVRFQDAKALTYWVFQNFLWKRT